MDKSFGLPSALAVQAMKPAHTPSARSAGVPLIGSRPLSSTSRASASSFPGDQHDRLAQRMNDVVVRRIFAAGLDLQAALGLIGGEHRSAGEHRATRKICHATEELDLAIRDLRDILFEQQTPVTARHPATWPGPGIAGQPDPGGVA